jgi:hypothetical protein
LRNAQSAAVISRPNEFIAAKKAPDKDSGVKGAKRRGARTLYTADLSGSLRR